MPTYQVTFFADKTVSDWDDQNGASIKSYVVDSWTQTIQLIAFSARGDAFAAFVRERYDLDATAFTYLPDEPGTFITSRLENANGEADSHGKYLADYSVCVTCRELSPEIPVGDLGLRAYGT